MATSVYADVTDGGYGAMVARLGSSAPNGAGVGVVQVEGIANVDGTGYDFAPNVNSSEFAGKTITILNSPNSVSWHSTTVGSWLYGSITGMAKGVTNTWVYCNGFWLPNNLYVGNAHPLVLPTSQPSTTVRVYNSSWIGSYGPGNESYDRDALRRYDYMMYRDGVLGVNGENNGTGSLRYALMGDNFNGLDVGRLDLQHAAGDTSSVSDNPGRMKPEIIAPGVYTSFSTPEVGAAAAVLFQQVQSSGSPAAGITGIARAQLVKAALLAGATRDSNWSNQAPVSGPQRGVTARPLDPKRGAGALNIDMSNQILAAARSNGSPSPSTAVRSDAVGFGSFTLAAGQKLYWRFRVTQPTPSLDFVATWPRIVASNMYSYTLANIDLRVYRGLNDATTLMPLEGDGGARFVGGGNVSSQSTVGNIEIVHLLNAQPGEYVVEVSRVDTDASLPPVSVAWQVDPRGFGPLGDVDCNGYVDSADLGIFLLYVDSDEPSCDLDASGWVDSGDLGLLLLCFD
jgi:hypothetical protein